MAEETAIILPPGVDAPQLGERGMIVNETPLPDAVVQDAIQVHFEEHASVLGVNQGTTFQTYAREGSLLARSKFRTPANVIDEIVLARDLAERDDDVAATLGAMLAVAFGEGMLNTHEDDVTVALFDEIARHANFDRLFYEMYREWLISQQLVTVQAYTREDFQFQPTGADRQRTRQVIAPLVGVLPAELIRVPDNDLFGTGTLAYRPVTGAQEQWLRELFSESTTAARRAEMRAQDPVLTSMLVEQLPQRDTEPPTYVTETVDQAYGNELYRLNPRMVHRTTGPKGAWRYPRPLLTRDFSLLEAKRLLNLMDYALLQGAANFLIVAKQGSDQRPAMQEELDGLRDAIKRASRSGVLIGDHRIELEIITPKLDELLNPAKRGLLGRKIARAMLRLPETVEADQSGQQAVLADVEILSRVIAGDRRQLKRHIENFVYRECVRRNSGQFPNGAASLWFPKIVLQGLQYFTDMVLKLRDRGDISRKSTVEAAGYSYDAEVEQRRREKASGDDRVLTPPPVPFSSPSQGPQDNNAGRPPGSSSDNGSGAPQVQRAPAQRALPQRTIARNAGETVRAMYDDDLGSYRMGEVTAAILEEYEDTSSEGRLTTFEQHAIRMMAAEDDPTGTFHSGPLTIVPVNEEYAIEDIHAVRLAQGLSMLVGNRVDDGAILARAFCFRTPEFSQLDAEEKALRWGYPPPELLEAAG